MAIIKVGKPFKAKFRGNEEIRVDIALGGLPVLYSQLKPLPVIGPKDDYKLALGLNQGQYDEVVETLTAAIAELATENGFALKKAELTEMIGRAVGPSKLEEGVFRFYGSKKMGYTNKETGEQIPFDLPVYLEDGSVPADAENLMENPTLGRGSVVRSIFTLSLFRKEKSTYLNINPTRVVVLKLEALPPREGGSTPSIGFEGLEDNYSF